MADNPQVGEPGQIPTDFRAARVLHCVQDGHYLDDAATRAEVTMTQTSSSPVPDDFITSLQLPDQEFARFSNMACSLEGRLPDYYILIDDDGHAVLPWIPSSPCGDPRDEVAQALNGITWVQHKTYTFEAPHL